MPTMRRKSFFIAGSIFFLVGLNLFAFLPVTEHEFINYDDDLYVYENEIVREGLTWEGVKWALTTFHTGNWHPLTWFSHMIDVELFGVNPGGHHLTSLIIHILNTIFLFILFFAMTRCEWQSALTALLFAIHPLHVESVAWVAERKDGLSLLLGIVTLGFYLWYVKKPKTNRYFLVILFFFLGLAAKPMLVTLPLILLLIDYWPLKRFKWEREHKRNIFFSSRFSNFYLSLVLEKIPLFILAVGSSIITIISQRSTESIGSFQSFPLILRIENALVSYIKYLLKTIWPVNLAIFYPYPIRFTFWKPLLALIIIAVITASVLRFKKKFPFLVTGWFWYIISLLPVIGIIQVGGQAMADRYTYIPLIGIFIILVWSLSDFKFKWPIAKIILRVVIINVILFLFISTRAQIRHWQDSATLFEHTLDVTTNNAIIHNNLGIELVRQGKFSKAIDHYKKAATIWPDFHVAYYNLGMVMNRRGEHEKAIEYYNEVIRIKPDYVEARINKGSSLFMLGMLDEAAGEYREALKIKPDHSGAQYNLKLIQRYKK